MRNVVERFVDEGDEFHAKALSCLVTLRSGCVREGEVRVYNEFVRTLRGASGLRSMRFWAKARDAMLGLITDEEAPGSTVTQMEARAFLRGEDLSVPPPSDRVTSAAPVTERDLEDMIE